MATVSEDVPITEPSEAAGHSSGAVEKDGVTGTQIVHAPLFAKQRAHLYGYRVFCSGVR